MGLREILLILLIIFLCGGFVNINNWGPGYGYGYPAQILPAILIVLLVVWLFRGGLGL